MESCESNDIDDVDPREVEYCNRKVAGLEPTQAGCAEGETFCKSRLGSKCTTQCNEFLGSCGNQSETLDPCNEFFPLNVQSGEPEPAFRGCKELFDYCKNNGGNQDCRAHCNHWTEGYCCGEVYEELYMKNSPNRFNDLKEFDFASFCQMGNEFCVEKQMNDTCPSFCTWLEGECGDY